MSPPAAGLMEEEGRVPDLLAGQEEEGRREEERREGRRDHVVFIAFGIGSSRVIPFPIRLVV